MTKLEGLRNLFVYWAFDKLSGGGVSRQDRILTEYRRGKIDAGELLGRTAMNVAISTPHVVVAVATWGESLLVGAVIEGAIAIGQQYAIESYEKNYEGRQEYSSGWSYLATGLIAGAGRGAFGAYSGWSRAVAARSAMSGEARVTLGSFMRHGGGAVSEVIAAERAALAEFSSSLRGAGREVGSMASATERQVASEVLDNVDKVRAKYASSPLYSSGELHSREEILTAFRDAMHTPVSRRILEGIEEGQIKVQFSKVLNKSGTTRGFGKFEVNRTMNMEDILSTIVHEGQHILDMEARIIPLANKATPFQLALGEFRAHVAAGEFARLNNFTRAAAFKHAAAHPYGLIDGIVQRYGIHGLSDTDLVRIVKETIR